MQTNTINYNTFDIQEYNEYVKKNVVLCILVSCIATVAVVILHSLIELNKVTSWAITFIDIIITLTMIIIAIYQFKEPKRILTGSVASNKDGKCIVATSDGELVKNIKVLSKEPLYRGNRVALIVKDRGGNYMLFKLSREQVEREETRTYKRV